MRTRTLALTVAGAALLAGMAGLAAGAGLDDPVEEVGTIRVQDAGRGAPTVAPGRTAVVAGLDEVSGTVTDDDDLEVAGVELDFGPNTWVAGAGPLEDYDGDGTAEALQAELDGLVGQEATFNVRLDEDGDEGEVYAVNGLTYRDVSRPAPWQAAGAAGEEEVRRRAVEAVGDGARITELEPEDESPVAWEAEVTRADGREFDVILDAAGEVLAVSED